MEEVTKYFEERIAAFIESEKEKDKLFRKQVNKKKDKSPEGACRYILGVVKESGQCGWDDSEIYGMVKHYYDEDNIKVPADDSGVSRVVVTGHIDLSESEKAEAKAAAERMYLNELREQERKRKDEEAKKEKERKQALMEKRKQEQQLQGDLFGGF